MNFIFLICSLFFLSFPLQAMEHSLDIYQTSLHKTIERGIDNNDKKVTLEIFPLLPDYNTSSFGDLLVSTGLMLLADKYGSSTFPPSLVTKLIYFFKKAIDDNDIPLLEEVLFKRSGGASYVLYAFKVAQKIELLSNILKPFTLSEQQFQQFFNLAFETHYFDLLKILIEPKGPNYFKEHYKEFLEKALKHQWCSLVVYILSYSKIVPDITDDTIQSILKKSFIEHAKAHHVHMIHFLLSLGISPRGSSEYVWLQSALNREAQRQPKAQAIVDLIEIFTSQGIAEYRDNPAIVQQKYVQLPQATSTSIMKYFSNFINSTLHYVRSAKPAITLEEQYNTPINKRNNIKQTELMWAALLDRSEDVTTLLINGAHVNARDAYRKTALFYAARYASPHIVRTLLAHGARTSLKDKDGKTPIEHASEANNVANVLLILLALKEKDNKYCIANQMQSNPDDSLFNEILLNSLWDPVQKAGNTSLNIQQYNTLT